MAAVHPFMVAVCPFLAAVHPFMLAVPPFMRASCPFLLAVWRFVPATAPRMRVMVPFPRFEVPLQTDVVGAHRRRRRRSLTSATHDVKTALRNQMKESPHAVLQVPRRWSFAFASAEQSVERKSVPLLPQRKL
eukprot:2704329-Rhodomonas_salina.2